MLCARELLHACRHFAGRTAPARRGRLHVIILRPSACRTTQRGGQVGELSLADVVRRAGGVR